MAIFNFALDYVIYSCGLCCGQKAKHFHCCQCPQTYINKAAIKRHLCSFHPLPPAAPDPPRDTPSLPQPAPDPPRDTPSLPQPAPDPPRDTPSLPQPAPDPPRDTPSLPQPAPDPPRDTPSLPQPAPDPPRDTPSLPQPAPDPPRETPSLPPAARHPAAPPVIKRKQITVRCPHCGVSLNLKKHIERKHQPIHLVSSTYHLPTQCVDKKEWDICCSKIISWALYSHSCGQENLGLITQGNV